MLLQTISFKTSWFLVHYGINLRPSLVFKGTCSVTYLTRNCYVVEKKNTESTDLLELLQATLMSEMPRFVDKLHVTALIICCWMPNT